MWHAFSRGCCSTPTPNSSPAPSAISATPTSNHCGGPSRGARSARFEPLQQRVPIHVTRSVDFDGDGALIVGDRLARGELVFEHGHVCIGRIRSLVGPFRDPFAQYLGRRIE